MSDFKLVSFVKDHLVWILLGLVVTVYLLLAYGTQYGWEDFGEFAANWGNYAWYLIIVYVIPYAYYPEKRQQLLSFDPQPWLELVAMIIATIVVVVLTFCCGWMIAKLYPAPYLIYGDAIAVLLGIAAFSYWKYRQVFSVVSSCIVGFCVFWISASAVDHLYLSGAALPVKHENHPRPVADRAIGIALSGGGYRAAVLHTGVLDTLDELAVRPTHLATVSGGSIIGAYYASGGTPQDFKQAVMDGKFNFRRELAAFPNPIRLMGPLQVPLTSFELFPWCHWSRADIQERVVQRLLIRDKTLLDIDQGPHLMIAMTDLMSGQAVSAMREGLLISPPAQAGGQVEQGRLSVVASPPQLVPGSVATIAKTPISRFVTASGAFPGAFPAVELSLGSETQYQLADGGLLDNTGIGVMLDADHLARSDTSMNHWKLDMVISSDGGQLFLHSDRPGFTRSVDVIYASSSVGFAGHRAETEGQPPVIRLSPANLVEPVSMPSDAIKAGSEPLGLISQSSSQKVQLRLKVDWDQVGDESKQRLANTIPVRREQRDAAIADGESPTWEIDDEGDIQDAVRIRALNRDLRRCVSTFVSTSTLNDQLTSSQCEDLYRLGQYLVLLRWGDIEASLKQPSVLSE